MTIAGAPKLPKPVQQLEDLLASGAPLLALAPMQDVTDLPFWKVISTYGGPDVYFTEYFRVHCSSNLEKGILKSITQNPTGKPVIAQMIGNDVPSLIRTARELQRYPIAAIDLNLGCPAPIVYRKCAGGGLLREPARVDAILGALRDVVEIKFTVKTRLGFDSPALFESLLEIFARHSLDLLTVHGRTVSEMYRSEVHYDYIRKAVERMPCPVLANGNIYSAERASNVLAETAAAGLMIGRAAIRNPWIFNQIRQHLLGEPLTLPTAQDVLRYIRELYTGTRPANIREEAHVQKMKKYMNFIALGIEPTGEFLHQIRRVRKEQEFFSVCEEFLDHSAHLPLEPFSLKLQAADFLSGEHC